MTHATEILKIHVTLQILLHDQNGAACCAINTRKIIGPISFQGTVNSEWYVKKILELFFEELAVEEKGYMYFLQDRMCQQILHKIQHGYYGLFLMNE